MARRRQSGPRIIARECRRNCGKTVYGLVAPIHATTDCHAKYIGICEDCITAEEKVDMLNNMAGNLQRMVAR